MLTKQSLIDHLKEISGKDDNQLTESTPLFSSGLLDSLSLVDLVAFIEGEENIRFHYTDIDLSRFDTVQAILELTESVKKRAS